MFLIWKQNNVFELDSFSVILSYWEKSEILQVKLQQLDVIYIHGV